MKKKLVIYSLLFLLVFSFIYGCKPANNITAEASTYNEHYEESFTNPNVHIICNYSTTVDLKGTIDLTFKLEQDEETLKKFQKYCKKKIDSGDVGFVFYTTTEYSANSKTLPTATYDYKVQLPKNLQKKDVAVIPFTDYRSPTKIVAVKVDDEGYISFKTYENIYAIAVVYNGAYKDLLLIGAILLVLLIICVLVKVYCVRKDNPYIQDKKKEKAIKKAKEAHHQNRILQKATKRQKEELKKRTQ